MLVGPASFMWMALYCVVCWRSLCCLSWSWTNLPITVGYMAPWGGPSAGLDASRETFHNNYGGAHVTPHGRNRITNSYCVWNEHVWLRVGQSQCFRHWIRCHVDCILFFHLLKWADLFESWRWHDRYYPCRSFVIMMNLQFNDQIKDQHRSSVDDVTKGSGPPTGPCGAAGRGEAGASSGVYPPRWYGQPNISVG